MTDNSSLAADITKRRRHHRVMGAVAFWSNELLFYCALVSSCAAALLGLLGYQNEPYFKVVTALPPVLLLVLGTIPFGARAIWHERFSDRLDALARAVLHERKAISTASAELSQLYETMRSKYPKVKWNAGRADQEPAGGPEQE